MDSVIYLRPDLLSAFGGTGGLHPSGFARGRPCLGGPPCAPLPHLPSCRCAYGWGPSVTPKGVRWMGRPGCLTTSSPRASRPPLCGGLFLRPQPSPPPRPPRTAPLIARTAHLQVKLHLMFSEATGFPSCPGFSAVSSSCLSLQEEGAEGGAGEGAPGQPLTSPAPSPQRHRLGHPPSTHTELAESAGHRPAPGLPVAPPKAFHTPPCPPHVLRQALSRSQR